MPRLHETVDTDLPVDAAFPKSTANHDDRNGCDEEGTINRVRSNPWTRSVNFELDS